jgi:hypothetical protein
MAFGYYPFMQGGVDPDIYDSSGQIILQLSHAATISNLKGADTAGDDLQIYSNSSDTYSNVKLLGGGGIIAAIKATHSFDIHDEAVRFLTTYLGAGNECFIEGTNIAGGDIRLVANSSDGNSYIRCNGASNFVLATPAGSGVDLYEASNKYFDFYFSTPDSIIEQGVTNGNIYLKPNGTGKVKFGTYAAITTETNAGYITILDAAGNSRKLCVVA